MRKVNRERKLSKERTDNKVTKLIENIKRKSEMTPKRKIEIENEESGGEWGERRKRVKTSEKESDSPTTPIWGEGERTEKMGGKIPMTEEPGEDKLKQSKIWWGM